MRNVAETIREATRQHLIENNGCLYAQCIRAVGWIGGTVPDLTEAEGIYELPTSDVSNSGIACGAALAGRRPIYVIRYQGFLAYNAATILNYAAKSLDMWDVPCPLFVRGIGMEGNIGPVASGMHHNVIARMPGIPVFAPMTPNEWMATWEYFLSNEHPVYCSEHRRSYVIDTELPDRYNKNGPVIIAIGAARLEAEKAVNELNAKNVGVSLIHLYQLKPLTFTNAQMTHLSRSTACLIVDSDYQLCGMAEHIAYTLSHQLTAPTFALGLKDKTSAFSPQHDNLTPSSAEIIDALYGFDMIHATD